MRKRSICIRLTRKTTTLLFSGKTPKSCDFEKIPVFSEGELPSSYETGAACPDLQVKVNRRWKSFGLCSVAHRVVHIRM
nr:hypothetical protein Iba_chr02eCG11930 [Ipomoea batatas]